MFSRLKASKENKYICTHLATTPLHKETMSSGETPKYKCPYPGCLFTSEKKYNYERHLECKKLHSLEGLEFKLKCNGKCGATWFTGAFDKPAVLAYLNPSERTLATCLVR